MDWIAMLIEWVLSDPDDCAGYSMGESGVVW